MNTRDLTWAIILAIYLFLTGIAAAVTILLCFPVTTNNGNTLEFRGCLTPDQGLILLALLAGIMGSFLHAAQSLISYFGNSTFKASWTAWYALRPWIGAILGLAIYFAFRAGLVAGASVVNPYGVVALASLGGWFSKTTTDKLQEVFTTLFKTNEDKNRSDKLQGDGQPSITVISPSPVPADAREILVIGQNFVDGATVLINGNAADTKFISPNALRAKIDNRPSATPAATVQVHNPTVLESVSQKVETTFE